jgi:hypothetical protein
LRRDYFLKDVLQLKMQGKLEGKRRRGRRSKEVLEYSKKIVDSGILNWKH